MPTPRLLVVENAASEPAGRLGEWLLAAGLEFDVRRPYAGEPADRSAEPTARNAEPAAGLSSAVLPQSLDGYAGLLVLGGAMTAADDARAPWLAHVRALLRAAVGGELPALAVGLGAQLLALANGGRVGPNPDGPEYGATLVAKRASAATDPLFGPMPITPDVIQWHTDAITTLPPAAVQLYNSPVCEQQAFRLGRLAWGIQFHIETAPGTVRAWAQRDPQDMDGYDVESISRRSDAVHEDIAEVWQPFAAAFADVVRDPSSVAPARPLRMSSAEPVTDPAAIRAALAQELHASRTAPLPDPGRNLRG